MGSHIWENLPKFTLNCLTFKQSAKRRCFLSFLSLLVLKNRNKSCGSSLNPPFKWVKEIFISGSIRLENIYWACDIDLKQRSLRDSNKSWQSFLISDKLSPPHPGQETPLDRFPRPLLSWLIRLSVMLVVRIMPFLCGGELVVGAIWFPLTIVRKTVLLQLVATCYTAIQQLRRDCTQIFGAHRKFKIRKQGCRDE